MKGRFIGQNIRIIEDIIEYCNGLDTENAVLFFRFSKGVRFSRNKFLY